MKLKKKNKMFGSHKMWLFERQQSEKDGLRSMLTIQIFLLFLFHSSDSIVRARASVSVYVPLTLVCRLCVCVCVCAPEWLCVMFSLILYFLFSFLLGTPYLHCLIYDKCWASLFFLLLFFRFEPSKCARVQWLVCLACTQLTQVFVQEWNVCACVWNRKWVCVGGPY